MVVEIDDKSGFCFGVVTAISKAEEALASGGKVYSLGDIVHNRVEVERLRGLGFETVSYDDMPGLSGKTLFIRAHGEPPATYQKAEELGISVIDATCPVVAHLQKRVLKAYEQMCSVDGQVVILGKHGHAEVVGLNGQTDNNAIIVESEMELLGSVDFSRPIYLLSQTTMSLDLFQRVKEEILSRVSPKEIGQTVFISDTICRRVSNRNPHLIEFVSKYDVILFVSGKESSNGKALYQVCLGANGQSYKIEDTSDIDLQWLSGVKSVGICGATSTPRWLMERVADYVRSL